MSYNDSTRDEIFERLGVYVNWWYKLEEMKDEFSDVLTDAITRFNIANVGGGSDTPSEADKLAYQAFSAEIHRQKSTLESLRYGVINLVSDFLGLNVKDLLNAPYTSASDVLDHLLDLMDDNDDAVQENTVSASAVAEDEDNSVLQADGVGLTLPTLGTPTQLTRDDTFSLVCTDDTTVDQEQWTLYSGRLGQFSGQIVTGEEVDWEVAGITDLKVTVAPSHDEEGDTTAVDKVSSWNFAGATRGTHTDEDGRVWLKFNDPQAFEDENNELGQVYGWDLTDLTFGEDTDVDGKVYVSVVKEPAAYQVLGGTMAVLDASGIIIDDADEDNTDHGTLYVSIQQSLNSDGSRDFTVELFNESDRGGSDLVATGTVNDISDTDLPVEITLEAETGGVEGVITLNAFNSVQEGETDDTILIKVPRYFVRLYSAASRSEDDLVAEAVSYVPKVTGTEKLNLYVPGEESSSFDIGDVNLNYVQDNEAIELTVDFYTIDLYKADPDDEDTTEDDIVGRAGSLADLLTGGEADLTFYPVNASGLPEVTVHVSDDTFDIDVVSAVVGYAAGDKFTFTTSTEDDGRFQTFLRDTYNKVFPSADGTAVTIPDTLAGDGLGGLEGDHAGVYRTATNAERAVFADGRMVDGDTLTITDGDAVTEVYEFDDDSSVDTGHIAVDISGNTSEAEDMADLVAVVAAESELVSASVDEGVDELVRIRALVSGSAANAYTLATDATYLILGGATLTGGSDAEATSLTIYPERVIDAAEAEAGVINIDTPVTSGMMEVQVRDSSGDPITDFTTDGTRIVAGATAFEAGGTVRALIIGTEA